MHRTITNNLVKVLAVTIICLLLSLRPNQCTMTFAQEVSNVSFQQKPGVLIIRVGDRIFATYTFKDKNATRPFIANVYSNSGIKVTRNYPTQAGDPTDHPHHQGIFFAFGDLNGIDYWHPKGKVVHQKFVHKPQGGKAKGSFTVENHYLSKDEKNVLLVEQCEYLIRVTKHGIRLELDARFTANTQVLIGSKEEGGIAIRVATPLNVTNGGKMTDNEGRSDGAAIWGKKAKWVNYSGKINGKYAGMTLFAHPKNPQPSWWHARDYGLLAANPFGPLNSKEGGVMLAKGGSMRLRFAVLVHSGGTAAGYDPQAAFQAYVESNSGDKQRP